MTVLDAAKGFVKLGVSFVPCGPDKRPKDNPTGYGKFSWDVYKTRVPNLNETEGLMKGATGIGIIGGAVSGNLETMDFEDYKAPVFEEWCGLVREFGLAEILEQCYIEKSLREGYHVIYRCESEVPGTQKLCHRMGKDDDGTMKVLCIIETRGEGNYACVSPTPGYTKIQGSLGKLPVLTLDQHDTFHALARSMDQHVEAVRRVFDAKVGHGVGDDFNARATWEEILGEEGWTFGREKGGVAEGVRPGKKLSEGISARFHLGSTDLIYVFTTSLGIEPGCYTKFGYWTYSRHYGDFTASVKDLVSRGYKGEDKTYKNGKANVQEDKDDSVPEVAGFRSYKTIERKSVDWLWKPYLPLGGLSICVGDPGIGKSTFAYALASAVSNGKGGGGYTNQEPGSVLLYCLEDDAEKVIVGKLMDNGADMSKIHDGVFDERHNPMGIAPPMTAQKMAAVVKAASQVPDLKLVVFDPVVEWFPAHRSMNTGNEAREILRLFRTLSEQSSCCVLVLGHPNKQTGASLMYRVAGSIDFSAVARSGLFAAKVPETEECALIHFKQNWGGKGGAIGYTIDDEGRFFFTGTSDVTEEMLHNTDTRQPPTTAKQRTDCKNWLYQVLAHGDIPALEVFKGAKMEGYSPPTVKRAKSEAGDIRSRKVGENWVWYVEKHKAPYWQDKEEDPYRDD